MHLRLLGQNKKDREGLALLAATILDLRSSNLMDLAASLPRRAERLDMRYLWISRVLGNALIDFDEVKQSASILEGSALAVCGDRCAYQPASGSDRVNGITVLA